MDRDFDFEAAAGDFNLVMPSFNDIFQGHGEGGAGGAFYPRATGFRGPPKIRSSLFSFIFHIFSLCISNELLP